MHEDTLRSRSSNKAYAKGYDRIFNKKKVKPIEKQSTLDYLRDKLNLTLKDDKNDSK